MAADITVTVKAIIFDFGGVLLDWNPRNLYRSFFPDRPKAMEEFLVEVNFSGWNALQDKGRLFSEGERELSAQFPQYTALIRAYQEHWEESIAGPIAGTVEILRQLKSKGHSLFGLSNWSRETFPIARNKYSFFDLFDDIVISGEVGLIKPEEPIYAFLLHRINYRAEECVFIDDSLPNINTARHMGFVSLHFQSPQHLEMELKGLGIL